MLAHEPKYKNWVLDYVDAWRQRTIANGGIIPTNVGLDGKIGSAAGGKWYGGVYGWGFSVLVPQTGQLAHRNNHHLGLYGFINAYLLTGDDRFLDVWRGQIERINSYVKSVNGKPAYPHMHGDQGWYHFTPEKYQHGALEIYYLSMKARDRQAAGNNSWLDFLNGKNPGYAEAVLHQDLERLRRQVLAIRADTSTPDTRLADDSLPRNPACIRSLIQLMLGGLPPGNRGVLLQCRLRYFDPAQRRAGLPADVAALVDHMDAVTTGVTLVNTSPVTPHTVIVQGGAYAEHQIVSVIEGGKEERIDASAFEVQLAPGCGAHLTLRMKRFANQPTLARPFSDE
jgi:hypothetical protein